MNFELLNDSQSIQMTNKSTFSPITCPFGLGQPEPGPCQGRSRLCFIPMGWTWVLFSPSLLGQWSGPVHIYASRTCQKPGQPLPGYPSQRYIYILHVV